MPEFYDTTWNKHGPVAATLLDNWVEERAVGADRVLAERNVEHISKYGHADILLHTGGTLTQRKKRREVKEQATAEKPVEVVKADSCVSRRRKIQENKWLEQALADRLAQEQAMKLKTEVPVRYVSTTMASFGHDFERKELTECLTDPTNEAAMPEFKELPGVSEEDLGSVGDAAVTFWSHRYKDNAHTVYCSQPGRKPTCHSTCENGGIPTPLTPDDLLHETDNTRNPEFGRNVKFSTPVAETQFLTKR